jgi:hypothetical protein
MRAVVQAVAGKVSELAQCIVAHPDLHHLQGVQGAG